MQIYSARNANLSYPYGDSTPLTSRGWHGPLASATSVRNGQRIKLSSAATPYRYYLIWLTTLPPGQQSASISDLTLFK